MNSEKKDRNDLLNNFFTRWLTAAFSDIQIFERNSVLYIAEILSRFANSDMLHRIQKLPHLKSNTVVEMLIQAEDRSRPSEPGFDPFGERNIRKNVADYTLFMTGIFREHIEKHGILDFYFCEGRNSYKHVYEFDRNLAQPQAAIFDQLHTNFEQYSSGINYMKKVYFDAKMPTGVPQEILKTIVLN